jgi:osmoprotectant transport system permease protein
MIRLSAAIIVLLSLAFIPLSCQQPELVVGSKQFTESVILGELIALLAEDSNIPTTHFRELGGTQLVFQGLCNGDIDIYPEYTGTIAKEILAGRTIDSDAEMQAALQEQGVLMSRPLGFNNTYALGMKKSRAAELGIESVSDLLRHPKLRFGFSSEFMDREDGWRNLQRHYNLPQTEVKGLDHDLAYHQLRLDAIDVIDVYSTDAKITMFDLAVLEDDLAYFPRYDAVLLYRADLPTRHPQATRSILRLEESISQSAMTSANGRTELDRLSEGRVARDMLEQQFGVSHEFKEESVATRIWNLTIEHVNLVRKSLIPAIVIAVILGIVASRHRQFAQFILAVVGIIQTIPALALLVILMPPMAGLGLTSLGLGSATAVTALFLYSLLPIVRNTYEGLRGIPSEFQESAAALGLPPLFRLVKIELPLASRSILAGIKTAAVINVGFATLGALIGAGGFGQPIITGMRLNDTALILQGAIPAAILALLVQGGFEIAERYCVPRGLRLKGGE